MERKEKQRKMKLDTAIKIIPKKYYDNITEVILKDRADGVYYTIRLDNPMPDGWKEINGAMTAPNGYVWIFNGKSVFSKEYEHALLKTL